MVSTITVTIAMMKPNAVDPITCVSMYKSTKAKNVQILARVQKKNQIGGGGGAYPWPRMPKSMEGTQTSHNSKTSAQTMERETPAGFSRRLEAPPDAKLGAGGAQPHQTEGKGRTKATTFAISLELWSRSPTDFRCYGQPSSLFRLILLGVTDIGYAG